LRAGIEIESDRDHVTSDMGLGNEGCKYAALWTHSCSLIGAGSRQASRGKGCVVDRDGMAGVAIDDGLDRTRKGTALVTAGAVSTAGGRLVALEHARGTVSAARLNPIGTDGGTVAARGS